MIPRSRAPTSTRLGRSGPIRGGRIRRPRSKRTGRSQGLWRRGRASQSRLLLARWREGAQLIWLPTARSSDARALPNSASTCAIWS